MEMIDIVDENDNVIDVKSIDETREKVLCHRGVVVLLLNSNNEVFVHQRKFSMKEYGGCWDFLIGGYVSSGESYEQAAKRELKEESGVDGELEYLGDFTYKTDKDDWLGKLFKTVSDDKIATQKEEIEEGFFIPLDKVNDFIEKHDIKPSTLHIYKELKEHFK